MFYDSSAASPAGIAGLYPAQKGLEPGDVVSVGAKLTVDKASRGEAVLGIISEKPGFVMGWEDINNDEMPDHKPVALSGRVPVKVTAESGPIKIGDHMTLSSKPGYAMKATKTGKVLGFALEDFEGTKPEGEILCFVNLTTWVDPEEYAKLKATVERLAAESAKAKGGK